MKKLPINNCPECPMMGARGSKSICELHDDEPVIEDENVIPDFCPLWDL